jgi:D-alanyl-D-alanine carboxypeptidase
MRLSSWIAGKLLLLVVLLCAYSAVAQTQPTLPPDVRSSIDSLAQQTLAQTGTPSASIAVVKDGKIAYVQAYGSARLDPATPARPEMRYSIGSISKQFTAAAILVLVEQGKLSLDDPVAKFVPGLTRGNEVTVRQLLSHTSGYQDYWPQDYVMPLMLKETSAATILDMWAHKPLDFDPGAKWQYSNTNYVIAGLIVEKVSGTPLLKFLHQHIFGPLKMESVADTDQGKLPPTDPEGYFRYALGPLRPAPKEGKNWLFAAGELAMTAEDLQKWNISLIRQSLLKPASYLALETETRLKNGTGTNYGLGVAVRNVGGNRQLSHGGEVSGFTASSIVLPDNGIAVAVLTNQDAVGTAGQISQGIVAQLLKKEQSADQKADGLVRKVLESLARGEIDRSLFTDNANFYFTGQALKDYAGTMAPLGALEDVRQVNRSLRGGMIYRGYSAKFAQKSLSISIFQMPDGKFEQYQITGEE